MEDRVLWEEDMTLGVLTSPQSHLLLVLPELGKRNVSDQRGDLVKHHNILPQEHFCHI
jgi:hypothetical protein